jgi:hypothetical protein
VRHQNLLDLPAAVERLAQLAHDWKDVTANERSVCQTWLIRFCEALGVEPPVLPTDAYRFELPLHIFEQPQKRDPRGRARAVTTEIAGGLAQLAAELKDRGFDTERVARFLISSRPRSPAVAHDGQRRDVFADGRFLAARKVA